MSTGISEEGRLGSYACRLKSATVPVMNSPETEQFDQLYGRLRRSLRRHRDDDLSQPEIELLHHVPSPGRGTVNLSDLARRLVLPKSTASALVKGLETRGFLRRWRNPRNERELAIVLTDAGAARVAAHTVLDPKALSLALGALKRKERRALLHALEHLVEASESSGVKRYTEAAAREDHSAKHVNSQTSGVV